MILEIATYLLSPFPLSYFYLKSRIKGKDFVLKDKFRPPELPPKKQKRIWLHGVSVGEVLSLAPLVKALEDKNLELAISTTTSTGMRVAKGKFPNHPVFYFPLDFPHVVERFLEEVEPDGVVIAETELWPNFILRAHRKGVKLFLVNGRISPASFRWYRRLRSLMKRVISSFDAICVQNREYYQRFLELGAPAERIFITGNMKADFEIKGELPFKIPGPYMVAGSTMDREEDKFVLRAFWKFRERARLVLAPRHPERAGESFAEAVSMGFSTIKRSQGQEGNWQVMILDTMGELALLYRNSLLSIIGGSIRPYGGHNLLEPAFFSSPVAFGPHMENFRDLAEEFLREGGALLFRTRDELSSIMSQALDGKLAWAGEKGREILERLKGATRRNAEIILQNI